MGRPSGYLAHGCQLCHEVDGNMATALGRCSVCGLLKGATRGCRCHKVAAGVEVGRPPSRTAALPGAIVLPGDVVQLVEAAAGSDGVQAWVESLIRAAVLGIQPTGRPSDAHHCDAGPSSSPPAGAARTNAERQRAYRLRLGDKGRASDAARKRMARSTISPTTSPPTIPHATSPTHPIPNEAPTPSLK